MFNYLSAPNSIAYSETLFDTAYSGRTCLDLGWLMKGSCSRRSMRVAAGASWALWPMWEEEQAEEADELEHRGFIEHD